LEDAFQRAVDDIGDEVVHSRALLEYLQSAGGQESQAQALSSSQGQRLTA